MVKTLLRVLLASGVCVGSLAAASFDISFTALTAANQSTSLGTLTSSSVLNNGGVNTINDPQLSITGGEWTNTGGPFDPLTAVPSQSAQVVWDYNLNSSKLNNTGSGPCGGNNSPCGGLGVSGGSSNPDAINGNDTNPGFNDALVFNFGTGQVASNSISFDIRGYKTPNDNVILWVMFTDNTVINITMPANVNQTNLDTATYTFAALAASLNTTKLVQQFAIQATTGEVGIGRLAFTDAAIVITPEPSTIFVVGAGIVALMMRRKRTR